MYIEQIKAFISSRVVGPAAGAVVTFCNIEPHLIACGVVGQAPDCFCWCSSIEQGLDFSGCRVVEPGLDWHIIYCGALQKVLNFLSCISNPVELMRIYFSLAYTSPYSRSFIMDCVHSTTYETFLHRTRKVPPGIFPHFHHSRLTKFPLAKYTAEPPLFLKKRNFHLPPIIRDFFGLIYEKGWLK